MLQSPYGPSPWDRAPRHQGPHPHVHPHGTARQGAMKVMATKPAPKPRNKYKYNDHILRESTCRSLPPLHARHRPSRRTPSSFSVPGIRCFLFLATPLAVWVLTLLYATGFLGGAAGGSDDSDVAAYRLDTGEQRVLIRGGTYARYVATGHLVYYRAGTIMAAPFDPSRLEVLGTPAPVVEGVMPSAGTTGAGQFSFSSLGALVYVPGGPLTIAEGTLVWVDRKGGEQPIAAPPRSYFRPRLSPDGRHLATEISGTPTDLWIYDFPRDTLTRLTFEGNNLRPTWTPDGKRIVFDSNRAGSSGIFWKPADGSGPEELLTSSESGNAQSLTPDGKVLAFHTTNDPNTQRDIWVLPMEGQRKPSAFLQTRLTNRRRCFHPTAAGWLMSPTNQIAVKSSCGRSLVPVLSGRSPPKGEEAQCGIRMGASSSSEAVTA